MNQETTTRRYTQPVPVSAATALHYRQYRTSSSVASSLGSIPDPTDLLNIKADLEALLPLSEKRIRNLQRDLGYLKKNVKVREPTEEEQQQLIREQKKQQQEQEQRQKQHEEQNQQYQDQQNARKFGSGKTGSPALMEKMQVKQETTDESSDMLHTPSSSHSKSQLERQLALEALRRKRRRDDDTTSKSSSSTSTSISASRSESPHHVVKLKRLDNTHETRSLSPPPVTSSHHHTSKPSHHHHHHSNTHSNTKKKKSSAENGRSSNKQQQQQKVKEEVDFIRVKAKDQVPVLTFWTTIDPHFRPLEESDREFLLQKPDDERAYHIPPLGRHYTEIWAEEDLSTSNRGSLSPATTATTSTTSELRYLSSYDQITEEHLYKDDISCGNLTERLLSSLVTEELQQVQDMVAIYEEDEDDVFEFPAAAPPQQQQREYVGKPMLSNVPPDDITQFEERLKSELRYAGLFGEDDVDWNTREDDEICAELRLAQRELKEQYTTNEYRKKRLLQVVDNQLQYEQYRHVLDNLDVQVEQCYLKRFRTQKSKKRKTPASQKSALSEHAVHAMGKRKAWVDALEGIFKDKNLVMPTRSIYNDSEEEANTAAD